MLPRRRASPPPDPHPGALRADQGNWSKAGVGSARSAPGRGVRGEGHPPPGNLEPRKELKAPLSRRHALRSVTLLRKIELANLVSDSHFAHTRPRPVVSHGSAHTRSVRAREEDVPRGHRTQCALQRARASTQLHDVPRGGRRRTGCGVPRDPTQGLPVFHAQPPHRRGARHLRAHGQTTSHSDGVAFHDECRTLGGGGSRSVGGVDDVSQQVLNINIHTVQSYPPRSATRRTGVTCIDRDPLCAKRSREGGPGGGAPSPGKREVHEEVYVLGPRITRSP